jgi:hypothetical protein
MTELRAPPKVIVWLSRHHPAPKQLQELERLFPGHRLITDTRAFDSVDDIITRFHSYKGDEMVVVAPLTVIRELVKRGIKPLRSEMKQVPHSLDPDVTYSGRSYRFLYFTRITDVAVTTEPLEAPITADTPPAECCCGHPADAHDGWPDSFTQLCRHCNCRMYHQRRASNEVQL